MVLRADVFFTQWVNLKTNTVTHNKAGRGFATDVTMFYNETTGCELITRNQLSLSKSL